MACHELALSFGFGFGPGHTEKVKCQVVRKTGNGKLRPVNTYSEISADPTQGRFARRHSLLYKMTEMEHPIHIGMTIN